MTEQVIDANAPQLPPIKIAFIIDGEVVDVLHTDERLGSIFLSQPVILDVTDILTTGKNLVGKKYIDGNFVD